MWKKIGKGFIIGMSIILVLWGEFWYNCCKSIRKLIVRSR